MTPEEKKELLTIALLMKKARKQEEAEKKSKAEARQKWKDEYARKRKEKILTKYPPEERERMARGLIIDPPEPLGM